MAQMRYPYTKGAQLAQFPFKNYFTKNWVFKSWAIGFVICLPLFAKITASIPEPAPKKSDH